MILYPNAHFKNVREIELGFLKEADASIRWRNRQTAQKEA